MEIKNIIEMINKNRIRIITTRTSNSRIQLIKNKGQIPTKSMRMG